MCNITRYTFIMEAAVSEPPVPAPGAVQTPPSAERPRLPPVRTAASPSSGTRSPCQNRRQIRASAHDVSRDSLSSLLRGLTSADTP